MRIENLMKCPMFLPYAGLTETRGWEIKPNKLSGELPPTRFFNPLLQRDWKMGKIKIYVNSQDNKVIGNGYIISKDNCLEAPPKPELPNQPTPDAVKDIPLVSEKAPLSDAKNIAKYADEMNKKALPDRQIKPPDAVIETIPSMQDIKLPTNASLADLNSEKSGTPSFPKQTVPNKESMKEIATFMKGPIG